MCRITVNVIPQIVKTLKYVIILSTNIYIYLFICAFNHFQDICLTFHPFINSQTHLINSSVYPSIHTTSIHQCTHSFIFAHPTRHSIHLFIHSCVHLYINISINYCRNQPKPTSIYAFINVNVSIHDHIHLTNHFTNNLFIY